MDFKKKEEKKKYDPQYYNPQMPEPTPEEQKKRDLHEKNVSIVKKFDELKAKFNDVLSYEFQALTEKEPDQKELFKTMFHLRHKKLREFIESLREDIEVRLAMQIPA